MMEMRNAGWHSVLLGDGVACQYTSGETTGGWLLKHEADAEWYVEVVDTYCKTVTITSQLRPALNEISPDKIADPLAIEKKWGLPDPRIAGDTKAIEKTARSVSELKTNSAFASQSARYRVDEAASRLTPKASRFRRGTE